MVKVTGDGLRSGTTGNYSNTSFYMHIRVQLNEIMIRIVLKIVDFQ